jgi:hypothetical protein
LNTFRVAVMTLPWHEYRLIAYGLAGNQT